MQPVPIYQKAKKHILARITSGELRPGDRAPSEHDLVRQFQMSRMTANRALRELASEGLLVRVPGLGSFVREGHAHGDLLHLRNIAVEIAERGNAHSAQVLKMENVAPPSDVAQLFALPRRRQLFHSMILHRENGTPIQVEDRYVNPVIFPNYAEQDFEKRTTYAYLTSVRTVQRAEHIVQAVMPSAEIRRALKMPAREPCLLIVRKTWALGQVATYTRLHHPGSRYDLTGRVTPDA